MSLIDDFERQSKELSHIHLCLNEIKEKTILEQPLFFHLKKYPWIQFSDVYKLIYQGSCGWAHLSKLGDETHVKEYLEKELSEAVSPKANDYIYEILDTETGLCRVNLRSWKDLKGEDVELLWKLMKRAKKKTPSTTMLFIKRWREFTKLIDDQVILYSLELEESVRRWLTLIGKIAEEIEQAVNLPLISHSPIYRKMYNPSYRIVCRKDILKEI